MKKYFDRVIYGGDYNPEQWPEEIWSEDMRIFKKAELNSATINVFSWAKLQPSENEYDFSELDRIVAMLSKEGYDIILATSTAAMPAWLFKKYPEVARTNYDGTHNKFGSRHNFCPNSLVYKKFARKLTEKIVERYAGNPHISCWHVNNEYNGRCYCENCEKAFRVWLKDKYGTLTAVNEAWNMEFWSHHLYEWDEIVLPNALSEGCHVDAPYFAGISIDYLRFNSDKLLELFKMERDIIRDSGSTIPITTNLMGAYKWLDYFKWAKEMDIVSWDNYPAYDTPWSEVAMNHDLMRGLKDQSFMVMEQTPSQQNYQQYNALKKPGQLRAQSYQALAHGSDAVCYFQLRKSKGACEKFHGAVIEHTGRADTRVIREVSAIGAEFKQLGDAIIGADNLGEVGIIFDWDSFWGVEYTSGPTKDLHYVEQVRRFYRYFYEKNIPVHLISTETDFTKYKLIIAPTLYMVKDGLSKRLEAFAANGGTFLTTYMSGIVDQSDNVYMGGSPGPLKALTGIWIEEIDALGPEQKNEIAFTDGRKDYCNLLCDIIHLDGAERLAEYASNFYQGTPVITRNRFGEGQVYYLGSQLNEAGLGQILDTICREQMIVPVIEDSKLEISCRETEDRKFYFLINFNTEDTAVPDDFVGEYDLITHQVLTAERLLNEYDVVIVERKKNK